MCVVYARYSSDMFDFWLSFFVTRLICCSTVLLWIPSVLVALRPCTPSPSASSYCFIGCESSLGAWPSSHIFSTVNYYTCLLIPGRWAGEGVRSAILTVCCLFFSSRAFVAVAVAAQICLFAHTKSPVS
ncbi:hypothetical protein CRM22_009452 [Opisthorchis felineus]|uniref:Uncharacterized protein n=1 Tax=Opisthorchis felineus TaxID=147828 RepID=A0A4S2LEL4_OPIFE|nr:hypothetical protein CRM22_009452 [Opisthorchis felineus]